MIRDRMKAATQQNWLLNFVQMLWSLCLSAVESPNRIWTMSLYFFFVGRIFSFCQIKFADTIAPFMYFIFSSLTEKHNVIAHGIRMQLWSLIVFAVVRFWLEKWIWLASSRSLYQRRAHWAPLNDFGDRNRWSLVVGKWCRDGVWYVWYTAVQLIWRSTPYWNVLLYWWAISCW